MDDALKAAADAFINHLNTGWERVYKEQQDKLDYYEDVLLAIINLPNNNNDNGIHTAKTLAKDALGL